MALACARQRVPCMIHAMLRARNMPACTNHAMLPCSNGTALAVQGACQRAGMDCACAALCCAMHGPCHAMACALHLPPHGRPMHTPCHAMPGASPGPVHAAPWRGMPAHRPAPVAWHAMHHIGARTSSGHAPLWCMAMACIMLVHAPFWCIDHNPCTILVHCTCRGLDIMRCAQDRPGVPRFP